MAEYIEREAAMLQIDAADFVRDDNFEGGAILLYCDDVVDRLSAIPAADVVPMDFHERCLQIEIQKRMALKRKRGEWRDGLSAYGTYTYKICSVCKCVYIRKSNFCPNCGADMREESL